MALVLNVKHFVDRFAAFAGRRFRRILRLCPWSARRATPRVLAARHSDNDFGFTPEDGGVDQGSHPEVLALHVKIYGALKKWELTKMVAKILERSREFSRGRFMGLSTRRADPWRQRVSSW